MASGAVVQTSELKDEHTRSDKVSHTCTLLQKCLLLDVVKELQAEILHLHQTNPHDSG